MEVNHLPNIQSAKKRVRVEAKANLRNRAIKSELKSMAKNFEEAIAGGDKKVATEVAKAYTGALDKARLKGTIHKNAINRKKGQISKALDSMS